MFRFALGLAALWQLSSEGSVSLGAVASRAVWSRRAEIGGRGWNCGACESPARDMRTPNQALQQTAAAPLLPAGHCRSGGPVC